MAGLSSQVIKCTAWKGKRVGSLLHLNTTLTEFLPRSSREGGTRYEIGVNESGGSCLFTRRTSLTLDLAAKMWLLGDRKYLTFIWFLLRTKFFTFLGFVKDQFYNSGLTDFTYKSITFCHMSVIPCKGVTRFHNIRVNFLLRAVTLTPQFLYPHCLDAPQSYAHIYLTRHV
jgi:hypothetical protein